MIKEFSNFETICGARIGTVLYDPLNRVVELIQIRIEEEALEKEFQEKGTFERKGGKRYGYWEISRIATRNGVFCRFCTSRTVYYTQL